MSKGRAKLREMGLTPIGLDIEEAAAFVGLSVRSFKEAVEVGIYPPAMRSPGRKQVWNRIGLEAALGAQRAEADPIMGVLNRALHQAIQSKGADVSVLSRRRNKRAPA